MCDHQETHTHTQVAGCGWCCLVSIVVCCLNPKQQHCCTCHVLPGKAVQLLLLLACCCHCVQVWLQVSRELREVVLAFRGTEQVGGSTVQAWGIHSWVGVLHSRWVGVWHKHGASGYMQVGGSMGTAGRWQCRGPGQVAGPFHTGLMCNLSSSQDIITRETGLQRGGTTPLCCNAERCCTVEHCCDRTGRHRTGTRTELTSWSTLVVHVVHYYSQSAQIHGQATLLGPTNV